MKRVYQLYALVSVGFISLFVILIAFVPEPFLAFATALQQQLAADLPVLQTLNELEGVALVYGYLSVGYVANLAINAAMALLAYLSENKFYFRLTLYALAINVIYFVAVVYTARLLVETVGKPLRWLKKSK
jgi:hypothetical protein